MGRLLPAGLLLLAGVSIGALLGHSSAVTAAAVRAATAVQSPVEPWQVGRCYRVFPQNRDQFYLFRVIEPSNGTHVRVAAEPPPRLGAGQPPPQPFWLVISSQFGLQEWPCSSELAR